MTATNNNTCILRYSSALPFIYPNDESAVYIFFVFVMPYSKLSFLDPGKHSWFCEDAIIYTQAKNNVS
ncbi:MAG TPA: hypothetical protein DEQ09_01080 [Bacteroidales bacterium]|nr:hypothetical protein [Bacteroidales bacterium]